MNVESANSRLRARSRVTASQPESQAPVPVRQRQPIDLPVVGALDRRLALAGGAAVGLVALLLVSSGGRGDPNVTIT